MRECAGNLWGYRGRAVVAITTNGSITADGRAVMGRGCARQAAEHFPDLPRLLGRLLQLKGNHVHLLGEGLVSFPVEETAWSLPDMRLIRRSAEELRALADREDWPLVVVPRPGCGGGGLVWEEVGPLLADLFDDRFVVIRMP